MLSCYKKTALTSFIFKIMADKRISQLVERTDIANNDVVPIVASGATTTNKATISSIQEFMQENLDLGVTSVGITLGTTGTDVNVTGSPITTSGNITINIPDASATARGVVNTGTQTFAGAKTFNSDIIVNGVNVGKGEGTGADNVRVGANTLIANTTGANNTALGARSLQTNTSGVNNTAIGLNSLQSNATGVNNTSIGVGSLNFNTSGFSNVAVGKDAGKLTSSGSTLLISINSIFIGEDTRPNASNEINQIVIGNQAVGQGSNTVTIGNSDITSNKLFGRVIHADAVNADESATLGQVTTSLGGYVTLDTTQSITATKSFITGGGGNTLTVSQTSGSGIALNITKFGNGEGLKVEKFSGTGNAMTVIGGDFEAPTIVKTGGTSSQFLMADGSVNTSVLASGDYVTLATSQSITGIKTFTNSILLKNSPSLDGFILQSFSPNALEFGATISGTTYYSSIVFPAGAQSWNLPNASGTIALTSDLSAYLPLTGGTLTGALNGTSAIFTGSITSYDTLVSRTLTNTTPTLLLSRNNADNGFGVIRVLDGGTISFENGPTGATQTSRLSLDGTTGAATLTGALNGTSASFTGLTVSNTSDVYPEIKTSAADADAFLGFSNTGDANNGWSIGRRNTGEFWIANYTGNFNSGTRTVPFQIASTGAATFSSSVTAIGDGVGNANTNTTGSNLILTRTSGGSEILAFRNTGSSNGINGDNFTAQIISSGNNAVEFYTAGPQPLIIGTNATERMRITSEGYVLVGSDTIPGAGTTTIGCSLGTEGFITAQRAATVGFFGRNNNGELFAFYRGATQVGNISVTTVLTTYNTTSDYRLKEDLQEFNGLEKLQAIKVYNYKWKSEDIRMDGVLAHELAEVLPYAVSGEKDGVDEDGKEIMQGVDYSKIVPVLIKAIQELKTEIDSLKNQIK
jgi:hypothetical protein